MFSLIISFTIVLAISGDLDASCQWPRPPNYNLIGLKYLFTSDQQLIKQMVKLVQQKCQLYNTTAKWMKQQGLDYMADRKLDNCFYDIQDTKRTVSPINQVKNPILRHQYMLVVIQWIDFWTIYLKNWQLSQMNCSWEDIEKYYNSNKNDLATMEKILAIKRRQVLQEMQIEIDKANIHQQDLFWIPFDTMTLDETKRGFEIDDKQLSKISDQSIKLKTIYMLLNTLDYTLRGYKAKHSE
ncbi:uncharacterized protein LOC128953299 [Oppia nitens]|uniref:uncharacterized protein LOC128953299 n=1 Tax=Oppia nitens TaxID=1686743 RepID=UPI0023DA6C1C|nr:uncharacterized protein LOC128953299 [Oppia nitens]